MSLPGQVDEIAALVDATKINVEERAGESAVDTASSNTASDTGSDTGKHFSPKAISILSSDSPYFDALWPSVIEQADEYTQKYVLGQTCATFRRIAQQHSNRRSSDQLREHYADPSCADRDWPGFKLNVLQAFPLWYEWGADKCDFSSLEGFRKFCEIADVDPEAGVPDPRYQYPGSRSDSVIFASRTGDLSICCWLDPRAEHRDGYVHYLGCTGVLDKTMKLEKWFKVECEWEEICHWSRQFI